MGGGSFFGILLGFRDYFQKAPNCYSFCSDAQENRGNLSIPLDVLPNIFTLDMVVSQNEGTPI